MVLPGLGAGEEDELWGEGEEISSRIRWEEAWQERSWATSSELSFAALTAKVRGMMSRDWANSPIANCSLEPWGRVRADGFLMIGGGQARDYLPL